MEDLTSLFDISKQIVDIIKQNYSYDVGPDSKLTNFTWNIEWQNEIYQLQLHLPKEWYWVEHGRNPSQKMPPVSAIEQWITAKRLVPHANSKGKVPSTRGLAFAIAKKIQKEGFYSPNHQGKHTLEDSLYEAGPLIDSLCITISDMLNKEVAADLTSIFDGLNSFK